MDQIRFLIGDYTEGDSSLPVQVRISPGVDSGSFLVTGMPGSGKSVCGQWLLYQLAKQGVPVIALDLHSTLAHGQIFPAFQGMFARRAKRHDLYTANLPCPLFQPMQFPDGTAETAYDTAAAIAGTLSAHFRFGKKQRSILTDACEQVIQSGSYCQMGIAALEGALQNSSSRGAQEVASRLRSLLLHNPFLDGQEPDTEPYIHIIDLTKYAGDPPTQSSIAELLLFYIWKIERRNNHARVVLKKPDRRIWWSKTRKEDKPMTIQIHPAEKTKEYTDLLLALLAQACIPALTEELLPEKDKTSKEARTA